MIYPGVACVEVQHQFDIAAVAVVTQLIDTKTAASAGLC
jgi:hypothetical protein